MTKYADFANNVVPAWSNDASAGVAGKLTDATRSIHVNAKGHEIDQTFVKGLIGGMGVDQIVKQLPSALSIRLWF